jgi:hypothetical protein
VHGSRDGYDSHQFTLLTASFYNAGRYSAKIQMSGNPTVRPSALALRRQKREPAIKIEPLDLGRRVVVNRQLGAEHVKSEEIVRNSGNNPLGR